MHRLIAERGRPPRRGRDDALRRPLARARAGAPRRPSAGPRPAGWTAERRSPGRRSPPRRSGDGTVGYVARRWRCVSSRPRHQAPRALAQQGHHGRRRPRRRLRHRRDRRGHRRRGHRRRRSTPTRSIDDDRRRRSGRRATTDDEDRRRSWTPRTRTTVAPRSRRPGQEAGRGRGRRRGRADPDDVEADLDTILKDRIAAADDDDEDEERGGAAGPTADAPDGVVPKRANEFMCLACFLLVNRSQFGPERQAAVPGGRERVPGHRRPAADAKVTTAERPAAGGGSADARRGTARRHGLPPAAGVRHDPGRDRRRRPPGRRWTRRSTCSSTCRSGSSSSCPGPSPGSSSWPASGRARPAPSASDPGGWVDRCRATSTGCTSRRACPPSRAWASRRRSATTRSATAVGAHAAAAAAEPRTGTSRRPPALRPTEPAGPGAGPPTLGHPGLRQPVGLPGHAPAREASPATSSRAVRAYEHGQPGPQDDPEQDRPAPGELTAPVEADRDRATDADVAGAGRPLARPPPTSWPRSRGGRRVPGPRGAAAGPPSASPTPSADADRLVLVGTVDDAASATARSARDASRTTACWASSTTSSSCPTPGASAWARR